MTQTEQRTQSLYRGIVIYWYRYADEGQPLTYTTTWHMGGEWQSGPVRRDMADAVHAAERRIDAQLRESRVRR